jgi:hypothetical protein
VMTIFLRFLQMGLYQGLCLKQSHYELDLKFNPRKFGLLEKSSDSFIVWPGDFLKLLTELD